MADEAKDRLWPVTVNVESPDAMVKTVRDRLFARLEGLRSAVSYAEASLRQAQGDLDAAEKLLTEYDEWLAGKRSNA